MAEKHLPALEPVSFILEYRTGNPRQILEDGKLIDVVDIIPEALRLETPAVKPILSMRQIREQKNPDITSQVAHRAFGTIKKDGRELTVTLDTSLNTTQRVTLTTLQQKWFTNYTESSFQIYRRVAPVDRLSRADAPPIQMGERAQVNDGHR